LALGVCASAASAEPLSMSFTEDRANVGVQLSDAALFAAPDTAPLSAQIDPGSGSITAGVLKVPQFATHITEPINADVTVDFNIGTITGSFTQATGALTLQGEAGGTLTSEGKECTVSTEPAVLTLTTAGNSGGANPRSGAPFTAGLAGAGAIAGQWTDMHATPIGGDITFCEDVESRIGGPGGIWLVQKGIVSPPPPPPPSAACIVPKLAGKTLARAKSAIKAAHCSVGKVHKPKRRNGKKLGPLVVKSFNPPAGKSLKAGSKVNLRLGPKPRKAHR
jgi:hypothetical protein